MVWLRLWWGGILYNKPFSLWNDERANPMSCVALSYEKKGVHFSRTKCVSICLRSCPSPVQSLNAINFIICNVLYQSCYIMLGKQGCFYWEYCSLQNFLYWEGTAIMLSSRPQNNTPPVQYSSLFETKGVTSHKLLDSLSLVADRVRWVPQGQKLGTNWLLKANQNWISCLGTAEQTS